MVCSSFDPNKKPPYTYFPMTADVDITELDDHKSTLDFYTLDMLARIIALEERKLGRISGLRVFCRLDVSVFRVRESGEHHYFVNEITQTHGAGLFPRWDLNQRLNYFYHHLSNTLHHIASEKLYLQPPPPTFK